MAEETGGGPLAVSAALAPRMGLSGSARGATAAAVASALALAPTVAHVVEDAARSRPVGFVPAADPGLGWFVGGALAVQALGALAALRRRRAGYLAVLVTAAAWVAVVAAEHTAAFLPGVWRSGLASRLAVWGAAGLQSAAVFAAGTALRASRRVSFSGTGSVPP